MLRHIASFLIGTFVMIIGYVWVIPYTLEAIDSNVSYITHHKSTLVSYMNMTLTFGSLQCLYFAFYCDFCSYTQVTRL